MDANGRWIKTLIRTFLPILLLFSLIPRPVAAEEDGGIMEALDRIFVVIEQLIMRFSERLFMLVINVSRIMYLALAALGILYWATGWNSWRGRQLVVGAIILAVVSEYLGGMS